MCLSYPDPLPAIFCDEVGGVKKFSPTFLYLCFSRMNPQQLHILLQATIQADQNARIEAEKILKSIETHNGFLSSLLQLAVGSDSTAQAGIHIKKILMRHSCNLL
jgi:hypothetical protein